MLDDLLEAEERDAKVRAEAATQKKGSGMSHLEKVKENYSMQKIRKRSSHDAEEKAQELIKNTSIAYVNPSRSNFLPTMSSGH